MSIRNLITDELTPGKGLMRKDMKQPLRAAKELPGEAAGHAAWHFSMRCAVAFHAALCCMVALHYIALRCCNIAHGAQLHCM